MEARSIQFSRCDCYLQQKIKWNVYSCQVSQGELIKLYNLQRRKQIKPSSYLMNASDLV